MDKFRVFVYMLMRDASLKQRIPCVIRISIFRAFSTGKKCTLYTGKYGILVQMEDKCGKVSILSLTLFLLFQCQEKKESNTVEKSGKEIVAEADRLDIKDKAVLALSELLFDKDMVGQISKYRAVFLRVSFFSLSTQTYVVCFSDIKDMLVPIISF